MIPTSVHGHMPFVKVPNSALKPKPIPYEKTSCKSCDCGLKFEGSISRKKVLRINKDQRLDSIPENIKNDILTKDRTWYAVVRALFRKGSKKKDHNDYDDNDDDGDDDHHRHRCKGQDATAKRYSALVSNSSGKEPKPAYGSMRLCETNRSKSLRLASIEEETDTGSTISISLKDGDPIRLISLVDSDLMLNQLSLSDQLKRKATSTLLKAHEDVASISSSSDSLPGNSEESLSTI